MFIECDPIADRGSEEVIKLLLDFPEVDLLVFAGVEI